MNSSTPPSSAGYGYTRAASHAGTWYTDNSATLENQLRDWLRTAKLESSGPKETGKGKYINTLFGTDTTATKSSSTSSRSGHEKSKETRIQTTRAIIVPHAGYSYSASVAGYSFAKLNQTMEDLPHRIEKIFVLGPSHHYGTRKALISGASKCATPVGDLVVDNEIRKHLLDYTCTSKTASTQRSNSFTSFVREKVSLGGVGTTSQNISSEAIFDLLPQDVDEKEHSLEMQYPFIQYIIKSLESHQSQNVSIIPIMIGATSREMESQIADALLPYFQDESSFFIVSSDFCHWGSRFGYQPYDANHGEIHQFIRWLDHEGIKVLENQNLEGWYTYMNRYQNTICGRHPIGVLLHLLISSQNNTPSVEVSSSSSSTSGQQQPLLSVKLLKYAQSSECRSRYDSSVSYAAAAISEEI